MAAVVVVAVVTAVVVAVVVVAEVVLLVDGLVVVEVGVKLSHPATSKHKYTVNSPTIIYCSSMTYIVICTCAWKVCYLHLYLDSFPSIQIHVYLGRLPPIPLPG